VADVLDTSSQAVSDVTKANPLLSKAQDVLQRQIEKEEEVLTPEDRGSQMHSPLSLLNI
jgi:hypothetical protein